MSITIVRKTDLFKTSRNIRTDAYETFRFLLAEDGFGLTLTDIVLQPQIEKTYGYEDNLEIAYFIEGRAKLTDNSNTTVHLIEPGTLWVAPAKTYFSFITDLPTRLICIFNPALEGHETGFAKKLARKIVK